LGNVYMEKKEYPNLPDAERIGKLVSSIQMPPKNH
jgi:hypothetical protein